MSEKFGCRRLLLLFPVLVVALLAASSAWPGATSAEDQSVDEVAVDVDVTGNGDAVLGTTESCNATPLEVGQTLDVDVVVRGVPESGTLGVGFDMFYDPQVVTVDRVHLPDGPALFGAIGDYLPFWQVTYGNGTTVGTDYYDPADLQDRGQIRADAIDLSGNLETGDGVLVRLTLRAVGEGVSLLQFSDRSTGGNPVGVLTIVGDVADVLQLDSFHGGAIIVGGGASCPESVPTFSPTPTPTPFRPTPAPTEHYSLTVERPPDGTDFEARLRLNGDPPGLVRWHVLLTMDHNEIESVECLSDDCSMYWATLALGEARQTADVGFSFGHFRIYPKRGVQSVHLRVQQVYFEDSRGRNVVQNVTVPQEIILPLPLPSTPTPNYGSDFDGVAYPGISAGQIGDSSLAPSPGALPRSGGPPTVGVAWWAGGLIVASLGVASLLGAAAGKWCRQR